MKLDTLVFAAYLLVVALVGILASRKKRASDDYFLASRNLTWWVIGGSLVAANISTHHFIGMAGQGFTIGLAIASYEWIAAIALIIYGKFFLPHYLKTRITTMPEFLENRFNHRVRLVFAVISLTGYIFIELAVVLYTGSLAMESLFGLPVTWGLLLLGGIGGGYTLYGGLRSVAFTDVVQVAVLLLGGLAVTTVGLVKVGGATAGYSATPWGGLDALIAGSPEKFHMVQSWNHPELPWIGVFFGGMWLANIFYWGCNQFITQRTLAARNVWHGQMGVVFAGYPRANARGCLTALIVGPVWASLYTVAETQGWVFQIAFLTRAGLDFIFCCLLIWLLRSPTTAVPPQAIVDRSFAPEDLAMLRHLPWWQSFKFWSGMLLAILGLLYVRFF